MCPYCALVLVSLGKSQCNELKLILPGIRLDAAATGASREELLARTEALLKSIDRTKKSSRARASTASSQSHATSRTTARKRRYYRRKK